MCAQTFQRVRRFKQLSYELETGGITGKTVAIQPLCPKCLKNGNTSEILDIPVSLRPWKLRDPRFTGRHFHIRFQCPVCRRRFANFDTFGAICDHSVHLPPVAYFCRFCCTKESPDYNKPPESKNKKEKGLEEPFQAYFDLNANVRDPLAHPDDFWVNDNGEVRLRFAGNAAAIEEAARVNADLNAAWQPRDPVLLDEFYDVGEDDEDRF